ncbi:MAG: diphthine synthase [Candidatus Bathyarchaeota archaeon]|nr:MAG: diphthine synthase [Candidatus Bathyarchaeota archaeon]
MNELVFIGLGLYDEEDISIRGLNEMKEADSVYAEFYTSRMSGLDIAALEKLSGKGIGLLSRRELEEESGRKILSAAQKGKTVLLVPGDPLVATTHVDLRIRAEKAGIRTRLVHAASILSAVVGLSGLQNYKFGRSVTVPFSKNGTISETPYDVIKANMERNLHTLCFLDIDAEENQLMTVKDALKVLMSIEKRRQESVIKKNTLALGIARAGSKRPTVKAGWIDGILNYDFGDPPHALVFPGKLHFMEAEALIWLANAPESVRTNNK